MARWHKIFHVALVVGALFLMVALSSLSYPKKASSVPIAGNYTFEDYREGVITTVAGNGQFTKGGEGIAATTSPLQNPGGMSLDAQGNLYITEITGHRIRKVTPDGIVTTFAGGNNPLGIVNGVDVNPTYRTDALFTNPFGLVFDTQGNLYVGDSGNCVIRKIDAVSGLVSIVAGQPGSACLDFWYRDALATSTFLRLPRYLFLNQSGSLLFTQGENYNSVRRLTFGSSPMVTTAVPGSFFCLQPTSLLTLGTTSTRLTSLGPQVYDLGGYCLGRIEDVAEDVSGIIYISSQFGILRYHPEGWLERIIGAGSATTTRLNIDIHGAGMALDGRGGLYFGDLKTSRIYYYDLNSLDTGSPHVEVVVNTNGIYGASGDGGSAREATLGYPAKLLFDNEGNLLILDSVKRFIRKVTPVGGSSSNPTTTLSLPAPGKIDTLFHQAQINGHTISYDAILPSIQNGSLRELYVADSLANQIYRFSATDNSWQVVAGTGQAGFSGDGGLAQNALLNGPADLARDGLGNIYFLDTNNFRVRKVSSQGIISTLLSGPVDGEYIQISNRQGAITATADGIVFLADALNHRLLKITPSGGVTVFAGTTGQSGFSGDGGLASAALFDEPSDLVLGIDNSLYVADSGNNRIRKINLNNNLVSTVVGSGAYGPGSLGQDLDNPNLQDGVSGTNARLLKPRRLGMNGASGLFLIDLTQRVRRFKDGVVTTVVGTGFPGFSGDGGVATEATMLNATALWADGSGNVFFAEDSGGGLPQRLRVASAGSFDGAPPILSGVQAQTFSGGARFSWQTNESATSFVRSGATQSSLNTTYGNVLPRAKNHTVEVSGTTSSYYQVVSYDATGNKSQSLIMSTATNVSTEGSLPETSCPIVDNRFMHCIYEGQFEKLSRVVTGTLIKTPTPTALTAFNFYWKGSTLLKAIPEGSPFSMRSLARIRFVPGTYRFVVSSDGQLKISTQGQVIFEDLAPHAYRQKYFDVHIAEDCPCLFDLQYSSGSRQGVVNVRWQRIGPP